MTAPAVSLTGASPVTAGPPVAAGVLRRMNFGVEETVLRKCRRHSLPQRSRTLRRDVIEDRGRHHRVVSFGRYLVLARVSNDGVNSAGNTCLDRPLLDSLQPPLTQINRGDV